MEPRVLMSKLEDLEQRARHLHYLETRVRDLSHELQLLDHLSRATKAILAAGSVEELLDTVLAQSAEVLEADKASILLYEPDARQLSLARARARQPIPPEGTRVPLGQGVAGYVALRRQPVHVLDIERDGRFPARNSARYATASFICVPIVGNDELLGVLTFADRRDGAPFSTSDLRVALLLAKDTASALERARRIEASEDRHRQFVSKLAHELRNPLDGVLRFVNLTLADHHPEERRRRYLLASKQGLERLTGIVNSLTRFSHYMRGQDKPVPVNDVIVEAIQLQEGKAEQRGVGVALDLAEGLPPVPGGASLFQVFTNLVSNAFDAMEASGGTLWVASRREGDRIVVRIRDTGCGMPPDVVARIFNPFFTTKPSGRGMGLGLAVCREIVGRLLGGIEVRSEPGEGTTFTVAVPCVEAREAASV